MKVVLFIMEPIGTCVVDFSGVARPKAPSRCAHSGRCGNLANCGSILSVKKWAMRRKLHFLSTVYSSVMLLLKLLQGDAKKCLVNVACASSMTLQFLSYTCAICVGGRARTCYLVICPEAMSNKLQTCTYLVRCCWLQTTLLRLKH